MYSVSSHMQNRRTFSNYFVHNFLAENGQSDEKMYQDPVVCTTLPVSIAPALRHAPGDWRSWRLKWSTCSGTSVTTWRFRTSSSESGTGTPGTGTSKIWLTCGTSWRWGWCRGEEGRGKVKGWAQINYSLKLLWWVLSFMLLVTRLIGSNTMLTNLIICN